MLYRLTRIRYPKLTLPIRLSIVKDFKLYTSTKMPQSYIITVKEGGSVEAAKQKAVDQGGKITHEYNLIKGFAVEFPDDCVHSLGEDPNVANVEVDGEVRIQTQT
ncbi:hypothetical protein ABW21_db0204870 [Orbilia brochopaga]|nr:hypothetical protein ABW21_db0204870 [Drechslerella brochopaga]